MPTQDLAALGISTVEELAALVTLFSGKQREPTANSVINPYQTNISPENEQQFRQWIIHNNIPFDPTERTPDYDMRGYWTAMMNGDVRALRDPVSGHFPDTWKTPYHRTFSNESVYANKDTAHWEGNKLVNPRGEVVYDENEDSDLAPPPRDFATGTASGKRNAQRYPIRRQY